MNSYDFSKTAELMTPTGSKGVSGLGCGGRLGGVGRGGGREEKKSCNVSGE